MRVIKSLFKSVPRVDASEGARRLRAGDAVLVDVREPKEWAGGVAETAALLPLSDLNGTRAKWRGFLAELGAREVLVYCASGSRSGFAARLLALEGIRAANAGGLDDWRRAGWPVVAPGRSSKRGP